jgi:hypothetical protein
MAVHYASGGLHPSQYRVVPVRALTGNVIEVFKQIFDCAMVEIV